MKKWGVGLAATVFVLLLGLGWLAPNQQGDTLVSVAEDAVSEETGTAMAADEARADTVAQELSAQIDAYLAEEGIDRSAIGLVVHDFESGATVAVNDDSFFVAASTYKLPLAMLYYDKIADGELALTDTFTYLAEDYEEGGPIGFDYQVGAAIDLQTLLHCMIVDSDNTAAHILYRNLGGWVAFKEACETYSTHDRALSEAVYYSYDNVFTAGFMNDCLAALYAGGARYETLLQDLQSARPDDYLNLHTPGVMAQKYGQYETAENAVGLAMEGHPYSVAAYTSFGWYGAEVIGDLNELCWKYFNDADAGDAA